ncbi:hypothetical protein CVT24_011462, partial [Panaeolus cyanescens]
RLGPGPGPGLGFLLDFSLEAAHYSPTTFAFPILSMSDWAFNFRTSFAIDSDSDSDTENALQNRDAELWKQLDLSGRQENVAFKPNPFTIAKINAANRMNSAVNTDSNKTHMPAVISPPAVGEARREHKQTKLSDTFQSTKRQRSTNPVKAKIPRGVPVLSQGSDQGKIETHITHQPSTTILKSNPPCPSNTILSNPLVSDGAHNDCNKNVESSRQAVKTELFSDPILPECLDGSSLPLYQAHSSKTGEIQPPQILLGAGESSLAKSEAFVPFHEAVGTIPQPFSRQMSSSTMVNRKFKNPVTNSNLSVQPLHNPQPMSTTEELKPTASQLSLAQETRSLDPAEVPSITSNIIKDEFLGRVDLQDMPSVQQHYQGEALAFDEDTHPIQLGTQPAASLISLVRERTAYKPHTDRSHPTVNKLSRTAGERDAYNFLEDDPDEQWSTIPTKKRTKPKFYLFYILRGQRLTLYRG